MSCRTYILPDAQNAALRRRSSATPTSGHSRGDPAPRESGQRRRCRILASGVHGSTPRRYLRERSSSSTARPRLPRSTRSTSRRHGGRVAQTRPSEPATSRGAFHPDRRTMFLLQDNVPAPADRNRIAEIDPASGSVLSSSRSPRSPSRTATSEVCASTGKPVRRQQPSDQHRRVSPRREAAVADPSLPVGVATLSGIGLNDSTGEAWVSSTNGNVWRLSGLPLPGLCTGIGRWRNLASCGSPWPDLATGTLVDIVKGAC